MIDERDHQVIQEAYSEYLQSYKWDFFYTITTRNKYGSDITLQRSIERWAANSHVRRAFVAIENGKATGRLHSHGLIKMAGPGNYPEFSPVLWKSAFDRFGRSTIEPIRALGDVSSYCSKYVLKGRGEYNFFGQWARKD